MTDQFVFYEYQNRAHKEYQMAKKETTKDRLQNVEDELFFCECSIGSLSSLLEKSEENEIASEDLRGIGFLLETINEKIKGAEELIEDIRLTDLGGSGDLEKDPLPGQN